jgi:hypothetical protein
MIDGLLDEEWDYICFQQVSYNAGDYESIIASLPSLIKYVKKHIRNAKVEYALHQTWAYSRDSDHTEFWRYDKNQYKMYESIVKAIAQAADSVGIKTIIPAGTAIQNGRTSVIGDQFCRDGFHLDMNIGRYTASCVWFAKLLGCDVVGNSYKPKGMSLYEVRIAQLSAQSAITKPDKITPILMDNY